MVLDTSEAGTENFCAWGYLIYISQMNKGPEEAANALEGVIRLLCKKQHSPAGGQGR